ncbi:MAG: TolC family protein [Bacteroidales bacterium]
MNDVYASGPCTRSVNTQLNEYRGKALEYNHDLKSMEKNRAASGEAVKIAKGEFLPKLSGAASYKYIGNPSELSLNLPMLESPVGFRGDHSQYGANISLLQPVYTGGRIRETLRVSELESQMVTDQSEALELSVIYQTDLKYWTTVANSELIAVSESLKKSIENLVQIIEQRVKAGAVSRNDLLMAEVKLNEAEFQLMQVENQLAINRMSLNSFVGEELNAQLPVDSVIPVITSITVDSLNPDNIRPELRMAATNIAVQEGMKKINDSKYLPQLHIGAEGSYSSPGYNFNKDLDPNYGVYAKFSMPIYQWGKRGKEKRISNYKIGIAKDTQQKIEEQIRLETESAITAFNQAQAQVRLSESSLNKAYENEVMLISRYKEGEISVLEALDGQLYRQNAQINYVRAKLNAQIRYSELQKALNAYDISA